MEHSSVLRSTATNNASAVMSDRFEWKTKQKKKIKNEETDNCNVSDTMP